MQIKPVRHFKSWTQRRRPTVLDTCKNKTQVSDEVFLTNRDGAQLQFICTNPLFLRSFSLSLSPSPSAGNGSLPLEPLSEPLQDKDVSTVGGQQNVNILVPWERGTHETVHDVDIRLDLPIIAFFLSVSASFSTTL